MASQEKEYCSNENCAEYSVKKINDNHYCSDDLKEFSATKIQALIRGSSIKKLLNPVSVLEKVYLTDDKQIIKYILKEGTGDPPSSYQDVTAHYTGKLLNGTKFDSYVDRNEPFNFTLGTQQVIKLWDIGFASMKKGEKAILIGSSDYCYGDNGSPPVIPPNAMLHFEVELIDFCDKPKEIYQMTPEEKIESMLKYKQEAKEFFDNNDIDFAFKIFKRALDHLCDEKHEQKCNLLINISICAAKLNQWRDSLYYADLAFSENPHNIKALYRLAMALYKVEEFEDCIMISKTILKLDNTNAQAQALLRNSMNKNKVEVDKAKKIYSKMF